jgi:hypothetical protein
MEKTKVAKLASDPFKGLDTLDALVAGNAISAIALMLWKQRFVEPDMYVQITEADCRGFAECCEYLKVTPAVLIRRPGGVPAQEGIPASAGRRAVAAREAIQPKPYVVVTLVEEGTENAIRPVENNQADFDKSKDQAAVRKARDQAQGLADALITQGRTGEYSLSIIEDAAQALVTMAGGLR